MAAKKIGSLGFVLLGAGLIEHIISFEYVSNALYVFCSISEASCVLNGLFGQHLANPNRNFRYGAIQSRVFRGATIYQAT